MESFNLQARDEVNVTERYWTLMIVTERYWTLME